jgi:putative tryptophan/tyrosine transport system substrate-binding protein
MERRALLAGTAGFLVISFRSSSPANSQPQRTAPAITKAVRIGVLYPGVDNRIFRGNFDGFREALVAAGYVEGRNLGFDAVFGDGRPLASLAAGMTQAKPDLILAVARSAVMAVHAATSIIPVIALDLESDPVASRFVKSLPRPGGNVTGVFMDFPELAGKWLEILKAVVPTLTRTAVLWDPATGPAQLDAARRAAETLRISLRPVEARTTTEIEPAFVRAMRDSPHGMVVLTSPIFNSGREHIVRLAADNRLPTVLPFRGYAHDGGLVSYGPDVMTMFVQAGALAVKILAGTPAAHIPVERPTRFTLSFNVKTAKALGLTIPPSLLVRADDVIE